MLSLTLSIKIAWAQVHLSTRSDSNSAIHSPRYPQTHSSEFARVMGMSGNACYGSCLFWSPSPSLTKTAAPAERLVPCQADLHFLNCSSTVKMAPERICKSHQNKRPWLSCHHPETKGQPASAAQEQHKGSYRLSTSGNELWRNAGCDSCGGEPSHNARDARHAEEIPQPGSFCSRCRMLFTGAWRSTSKPGGDLSQRGVAARGESRAPGTRSGFESTLKGLTQKEVIHW